MTSRETIDASAWLLDQAQEDTLHANRLINIEERPFQRISKALLGKGSTIRHAVSHYPSPPPEDDQPEANIVPDPAQLQAFREHILLDFAALESSIVRIQLIHKSNERERERFAAEKAKILNTAQAVRENTIELRTQLTEAQRILQLRKGYDEIAGRILDDQKLKSRDETRSEIERLEKEIEDLKQESVEYEGTWLVRRTQFDRVSAEGQAMVRQIRGIKDEPEDEDKDEDMEDDEGTKEHPSRVGSEGPDGRTPRQVDAGSSTPMPEAGDMEDSASADKFTEAAENTQGESQIATPVPHSLDLEKDVEMVDASGSSAD